MRTAAALRIWKPPGDGGLPSTSWSSPRAVRAATLRRRGSARHIPFQKPESRKTPADGADPHHTRRRKGRLPAPPRKTEKQVTPGVQRPGPRPQNGGDGMGNINPEGKTPHGRGSGAMPSVATGTAWENPAQTGVCHRKCWSSSTGNHNPARRGLNQGPFPGKRQHHLPRATGAKPRSRDPCAHTGTAPRRRQGRHPVSHGTMSPDTKDRLSGS